MQIISHSGTGTKLACMPAGDDTAWHHDAGSISEAVQRMLGDLPDSSGQDGTAEHWQHARPPPFSQEGDTDIDGFHEPAHLSIVEPQLGDSKAGRNCCFVHLSLESVMLSSSGRTDTLHCLLLPDARHKLKKCCSKFRGRVMLTGWLFGQAQRLLG